MASATLTTIFRARGNRRRPGHNYRKRAVAAIALTLFCLRAGWAQDAGATNAAPADMADTVKSLLTESSQDLAAGNYESAIRDASTAIQLDPHNPSAFELRGSIYIQEKLWDRAERDYTVAAKISPDPVYKFKLADIKFLAKQYEDARPRFAALEDDANLGDFAKYKAFLCDLLGFHEAGAMQDLAALDQGPHTPPYYYAHAAWDLYHNQRAEASKYFAAAGQQYDRSVADLYIGSLLDTRRFRMASATFVTKDGTEHNNASIFLEGDGLRVSTANGWITVPIDQLPDDLSAFPEEIREQIDRKRAIAPEQTPTPVSLVSFTTRSGKTYDQVRWSVEDSGLSVLTKDGWILVPLRELPDDRSSFPPELLQELSQRQVLEPTTPDRSSLVSFTTIQGKTYTEAKAFLAEDGLRVVTQDGWITVPFHDLPADLSTFPPDWQPLIQARRSAPVADPTGMEMVTFTTRKGVHYDQVRASLSRTGLRLVTTKGWVEVPFKDLPRDVSVFPELWRETISARETEVVKDKVTPN